MSLITKVHVHYFFLFCCKPIFRKHKKEKKFEEFVVGINFKIGLLSLKNDPEIQFIKFCIRVNWMSFNHFEYLKQKLTPKIKIRKNNSFPEKVISLFKKKMYFI